MTDSQGTTDKGGTGWEKVKGVKKIRTRLTSRLAAGKDLSQQAEHIKREGICMSATRMRQSILQSLHVGYMSPDLCEREGVTPQKVENVILPGCVTINFGSGALRSICRLFQRLGIDYGFLDVERCCGATMLMQAYALGKDRAPVDQYTRDFVSLNIASAKEKGAKNMVYVCTWCIYRAKSSFPDGEIQQLYYPDLLLNRLDDVSLKLGSTIGYYGGCPHRRQVYDLNEIVELDWNGYRRLLDKVEGLNVVDIPRYCCSTHWELVFQWAQKRGLDTIVTPCEVCYRRLGEMGDPSKRRTELIDHPGYPGIKVKFLTDVLLEAMGESSEKWA